MKKKNGFLSDSGYYNFITLFVCLGIIVLTSCVLLVVYIVKSTSQDATIKKIIAEEAYNEAYFSNKILPGVTVSGNDIGGLDIDEAKEKLSGNVEARFNANDITLKFEDKTWTIERSEFQVGIDIGYAVKRAYAVSREGTLEERQEALEKIKNGETIDISATIISNPENVIARLKEIKSEIDIERKNATASFKYDNGASFTYTDEVVGRSLDLDKAYNGIIEIIRTNDEHPVYELKPDTVEPTIKRSDIEKDYTLVAKCSTYIGPQQSNRRTNITIALAAFNEQTWMPGQTLSFNEVVGERTADKGFGNGVYINEQQLYDETMGGGICQVSTTIFNCALAAGANKAGQHAPIIITERRPHTWPSSYIAVGLDATISWPHTDLKMYNNSQTPYFIRTYMTKTGVNVELYGAPLPNNAKVSIENEVVEEVQPGEPEMIVDTENKYNLAPGEQKLVQDAHTGYTVNVYQIWKENGKEDIKTLITVSKYNAVAAKYYVSPVPAEPQ